MDYPKWLYHRTERAVIVNNPDEELALGEGWESTPAAFDAPAPAGEPAAPAGEPAKPKKPGKGKQ